MNRDRGSATPPSTEEPQPRAIEPLFHHRWPVASPRAALCLVHGLGEHGGRYGELGHWFNARRVDVRAVDLRGHGRSPGPRGHARWERLLDDIGALVALVARDLPGVPRVLYGHSVGGLLVIDRLLRRPTDVAAAVATSPALRPAFEPPAWKITAGRLAGRLWPRLSFANEVDGAALARDPQVERRYLADPLVHDRVSAALGLDILAAGARCLAAAPRLPLPLLLVHGDGDRITSHAASHEFAVRAGERCSWRSWPDGYHELHNDTGWQQVLAAILAWIDRVTA